MATTLTLQPTIGGAGSPAFPSYPSFISVPIPNDVSLVDFVKGKPIVGAVTPVRAWQGRVQPFENDTAAREVLRLLAADIPVYVHGGNVIASSDVRGVMPHPAEPRMIDCATIFDLLVLEFEAPAHPWVFSLSPAISSQTFPYHPHLRSDRILKLPSRTLHGLCVYSGAEFDFEESLPVIPQFLNQVSIFLAKHIVWRKTQRLFDTRSHELLHDGLDTIEVMSDLPHESIWQINPALRTEWVGFWPGKVAMSGKGHLLLDPEGKCWCGKGRIYRDCCLPEDKIRWSV
jgi:hypothetical protein